MRWLWHDRVLLVVCLVIGLLISYQLGVTIVQPAWKGAATDWLRAALAWPELLLVVLASVWLTRTRDPAAWSWWMLSAVLVFYAVAQNLWAVFEQLIYTQGVPFPSLADLFYLLQYPFVFLAILLYPSIPSWESRTKVAVDTLLWVGAVTALFWYFILAPLYQQSGESPLEKMVSLGYPLGDLVILFGLTRVLMRSSRGGADRLALTVLVVAVVCDIVAYSWSATLRVYAPSSYATGGPPDLFWLATHLLIALAGMITLRLLGRGVSTPGLTPQAAHPMREEEALPRPNGERTQRDDLIASVRIAIPFVAALLASVAIMVRAAMNHPTMHSIIGPLAVSVCLLLLAIVRQEITLLENAQVRRERESDRANALALRETNRRIEEFLNIASHELKTPLTSLQAMIQVLVRRFHAAQPREAEREDLIALVEMAQSALERSLYSLHRIGRLIEDLLDVARIREGLLELRVEPCDLVGIVQAAVQEQQLVSDSRPIHVELPTARPVLVLGDPDRIGQVVTNYLTNALKYSRADQPIEVSLRVEGEVARVAVHDEGIGLSAEEQVRVWERFYRVSGVAVQSGSSVGMGMGLHICKTIIERLHGQVGVHSALGQGSTFWFTVPLACSTT